ncbi:hypothetical protein CFP56_031225 [Quercus suber]|uniref:Uncharacterized protein n=1 Tax=Quercus suber TaxID=58331 RepID=A0AAW0JLG2_QUESU
MVYLDSIIYIHTVDKQHRFLFWVTNKAVEVVNLIAFRFGCYKGTRLEALNMSHEGDDLLAFTFLH